ncbi:hypothetical protein B0I29_1355 [Actinoplanes lutulentus]|uniref:Uncharacterized protein n=2 Tax=Actinoplanes lutulentus TaxID=1287878 RepID=A0A327YYH0_9ACTN|nr:hypothetical protein B0I29_1355 [Actinoplanes lutulentus]
MLKPTAYLPEVDWHTLLNSAPKPSIEVQAAVYRLNELLGKDAGFDAANTVAATEVTLIGVERIADAMAHAAPSHDLTELARLVCGLHLVQAHLTQTILRIADHVSDQTFSGATGMPAEAVDSLTQALRSAGANGATLCWHLKPAHKVLRDLNK